MATKKTKTTKAKKVTRKVKATSPRGMAKSAKLGFGDNIAGA